MIGRPLSGRRLGGRPLSGRGLGGVGLGLTLSSRQGAGGGATLPFNAPVGAVGDSILWAQSSATNPMRSVCDITLWANALSGGRCLLPFGYDQAIGGDPSSALVSQLELLPPGIKIVIANGGTNNLANGSATILGHWDAVIAWCAARDIRLVIIPILPRSANDGTAEATRAAVNAGLAARASTTVAVIDISWFDYSLHCYPQPSTAERVHPNVIGVHGIAAEIAAVLTQWVRPGDPLSQGVNAHPNGLMVGTGGTLNTYTGVLPDGWVGNQEGGSGNIIAACSRPARAAGGNWLQMVLGGTYNEGNRAGARYTVPGSAFTAAGITGGDLFEICFDIEVDDDLVNVDTIYVAGVLFAIDFDPIINSASGYLNTTEKQGGFTVPAYSGKVRMMPFGLPAADTVNWMLCDIVVHPRDDLSDGSAIAGTFRVGGINIRKIDAGAPYRMAAPSLTPGNGQISVTRAVDPHPNGAAITGYDLRYSTDEINWTVVAGISNPEVIGSLTNGTPYYVQTRAINAAGNGPWSPSASAAPTAAVYETDFSTDAGWSYVGTGVSINTGACRMTSPSSFASAERTISGLAPGQYKITWTVVSISGMAVRVVLGNAVTPSKVAPGTYEDTITVASGTNLNVQSNGSGGSCVIDDLKVEHA